MIDPYVRTRSPRECTVCGGLIAPDGVPFGYAGKQCLCDIIKRGAPEIIQPHDGGETR